MELMLFTCARSIHINTDRKELKQVLHFRFSFEPRFSEVDKSLFLAPPLRTTSCNVHYSGPILYDNERETWSKSKTMHDLQRENVLLILSLNLLQRLLFLGNSASYNCELHGCTFDQKAMFKFKIIESHFQVKFS